MSFDYGNDILGKLLNPSHTLADVRSPGSSNLLHTYHQRCTQRDCLSN